MEFEVLGGSPSLSTIAYKTITDKSSLVLKSAPYIQDVTVHQGSSNSPTWKGITNSAPLVETNLVHTIMANINTDAYSMPVIVNNTFGILETNKWVTNLNPQNDVSAYRRIPESSMLGFDYYDGYNWRFDTTRTSLKVPPDGYPEYGFVPNETLPFLTMPPSDKIPEGYYTGLTKQQISISQGNYSVINRYNIKLTNFTDSIWKFNYKTDSKSGVVVGINVDGDEMLYSCAGSFEDGAEHPRYVGRTIEIASNSSINITVDIILTAGNPGWIENEFYLSKVY